jgi:hypothetical protein
MIESQPRYFSRLCALRVTRTPACSKVRAGLTAITTCNIRNKERGYTFKGKVEIFGLPVGGVLSIVLNLLAIQIVGCQQVLVFKAKYGRDINTVALAVFQSTLPTEERTRRTQLSPRRAIYRVMTKETPVETSVDMEVDVLIVGAGPTGSSLACFLGSYGTNIPCRWHEQSISG